MVRAPIAGLAALLACGPLAVPPSSEQIARCPRACPASCAGSCLPSGYCSQLSTTAGALGLSPAAEGDLWRIELPGFPPGADVSYALHFGFDVAARAGRIPASPRISVSLGGSTVFLLEDQYRSFPVWGDDESHAAAALDGTLRLPLQLAQCLMEHPSTCSIDPSSTVTATLSSTGPWLQAPPCE